MGLVSISILLVGFKIYEIISFLVFFIIGRETFTSHSLLQSRSEESDHKRRVFSTFNTRLLFVLSSFIVIEQCERYEVEIYSICA